MDIEQAVRNLETRIAQEADLMSLARAWMRKTNGVLTEDIILDENEYIRLLQSIPLFADVQDNLKGYTNLLSRGCLRGVTPYEREVVFGLREFPLAMTVVEAFLEEPDYSLGRGTSNFSFADPLGLIVVLDSYQLNSKERKDGRGTGVKIASGIRRQGVIAEERFLEFLGLKDEFNSYLQTRGLPRKYRMAVKKMMESFLTNPDYSMGRTNGSAKLEFGMPLTLTALLSSESGNDRNLKNSQIALERERIDEEEFIRSVDLEDEWKQYQKTRGIPRSYKELAKSVVEDYLKDQDYSIGKGKSSFGEPLPLRTVLRDHQIKAGKRSSGEGNANRILKALRQNKITDEQLLSAIGLEDNWKQYQQTTGIPKPYREVTAEVLSSFLADPDYVRNGSYKSTRSYGQPLTLRRVLREHYLTTEGDSARQDRTIFADNVRVALARGRLTEDQLLDAVGLKNEWEVYQGTRGVPKVDVDEARQTIAVFLANPQYLECSNKLGEPISLASVLRRYDREERKLRENSRGTSIHLYERLQHAQITEEEILNATGLTEQWAVYQQTTSANPFVWRESVEATE